MSVIPLKDAPPSGVKYVSSHVCDEGQPNILISTGDVKGLSALKIV